MLPSSPSSSAWAASCRAWVSSSVFSWSVLLNLQFLPVADGEYSHCVAPAPVAVGLLRGKGEPPRSALLRELAPVEEADYPVSLLRAYVDHCSVEVDLLRHFRFAALRWSSKVSVSMPFPTPVQTMLAISTAFFESCPSARTAIAASAPDPIA